MENISDKNYPEDIRARDIHIVNMTSIIHNVCREKGMSEEIAYVYSRLSLDHPETIRLVLFSPQELDDNFVLELFKTHDSDVSKYIEDYKKINPK